jgi:hypothetical protein
MSRPTIAPNRFEERATETLPRFWSSRENTSPEKKRGRVSTASA